MHIDTSSADRNLKTRLFHKLHPSNFENVTGTMRAIIGYLLSLPLSDPVITAIAVSPAGYLFADTDEEIGRVIGHYDDLIVAWHGLLRIARLATDERILAESLFAAKIGYFGQTTA